MTEQEFNRFKNLEQNNDLNGYWTYEGEEITIIEDGIIIENELDEDVLTYDELESDNFRFLHIKELTINDLEND